MIIEVKKLIIDRNERQSGNEFIYTDITQNLEQSIKQLRTFCIHEKQDSMIGVITNFKDWIFTKYNLKAEMENEEADNQNQEIVFEYS
jgi:hypothetical protein